MRPTAVLAWLVTLDLASTALIWAGARAAEPPGVLPAQAPVVIFYSSEPAGRDARVKAALEIYLRHGRRQILCVGGSRPAQGMFGSEDMARQLRDGGVAAGDISTERQSRDTIGNVAATLQLAKGARTLLLVSEPLHLARITWLLRRSAPEIELVTYPVQVARGPIAVLWRVHYEAVAWLSMLLPDSARRAALKALRP